MYALTTAVLVRSYSRISGRMSDDTLIYGRPLTSARTISAARRSWAGLAYECSRQIATDSTPSSRSRLAISCACASSSGFFTSPRGARRSGSSDGLPAGPEALGNLVAQPPRHERCRFLVLQVVHHRDAQAPHFEHIAEALGRNQR